MRRIIAGFVLLAGTVAAQACSLCGEGFRSSPTFRQEASLRSARAILHGTITNPRLEGADLKGKSDFNIKSVIRSHAAVKGKKTLVLPRYMPVPDKDAPPQYLLFCDIDRGAVDPYRGVPVKSERTVEYLKKALALDKKDVAGNLAFFFGYLDDADPEVARDAFLEFARANDAEVAKAAPKLDAAKLRAWIKDPKTQPGRHGLYAMLLGACGKAEDAEYLKKLLDSKEERYQDAADGLLAGLVAIDPKKGWELVHSIVSDGRKPLSLRIKATGTLRFLNAAKGKEAKDDIVKAMRSLLVQGDLADLAIEDLRTFKLWDLTKDVLACHGKKGYDSPLMRRAILRYALSAPASAETKTFLDARRKDDPDTLKEVEEGLRLERAG